MSEPYLSRENRDQLRRLAGTDAGRALFAYLQKHHGPALRRAMERAAAGDYAEAKRIAGELLSSPEAKELLRQLGH